VIRAPGRPAAARWTLLRGGVMLIRAIPLRITP